MLRESGEVLVPIPVRPSRCPRTEQVAPHPVPEAFPAHFYCAIDTQLRAPPALHQTDPSILLGMP